MEGQSIGARRWLALPILCLSVFVVIVDNTIVNVALPSLSRDLGASTTSLQWIVDAYSLAFAGLLMAGGAIGDHLGRKGVMQVGLALFAAFSGLAAASHSTETLIAARALMGASAALIFPATLAILTSMFPDPSERQKALGIWGATSGIAVAFGPIVGGALLEHFWYGSVFLVNLPLVMITLVAGQLLIPKVDHHRATRFDGTGVLVSAAGVTALVLAIIEGPQWGWKSAGTLACFAAAIVLIIAFCLIELRKAEPLLDVRIFRTPRFTAGVTSIGVAFFALFGFIFLITQYFQFVKGYSPFSAGVHTLPFAVVAVLVTPAGALLALRIGARVVVASGLLFMGAGLVVAGLTSTPKTAFWGPIVVSEVLLALGLSLLTAPAIEAMMGSLPPEQVGAGAAVNNTTRELFGTLGVAIFGSVFASAYAPKIDASFGSLPIPAAAKQAASESMAGALEIAGKAPTAIQPALAHAANLAFEQGLRAASLVGAGATALGACLAVWLLPGRRPSAALRARHAAPRHRRGSEGTPEVTPTAPA
jgi:EmrB/QacA subfamily drug resistance transporter